MHMVAMTLFALVVAVAFALISKNAPREQFVYGARIFFAFMGIGLLLAWLMYPIS
jgi:hypothetical protein